METAGYSNKMLTLDFFRHCSRLTAKFDMPGALPVGGTLLLLLPHVAVIFMQKHLVTASSFSKVCISE